MAISQIELQYKYSGKGPVDAKALVKTYADLLNPKTWYNSSEKSAAYNGMVVAVWLDSDSSKNGLYFLHDALVTSVLGTPDVTNEKNWYKVANLDDLEGLTGSVENLNNDIIALKTSVGVNTDKLAGIENEIDNRVAAIVNSLVIPKASKEISVAQDGTLGINELSTDKLVQGSKTLVFSGGTASTTI